MEKRDGFIPKEDIEFEKELRRQELEEEAERERLTQEKKETEERERAEYEKNLQDRKIELMKLKQGVIESSDVIKEVHEEKPKLSLGQKISGAWYRSKWLILFVAAMIIIVGYITFDMVTAEKVDYNVLVVSSDPGFYYRTQEIEEFFESYADDKNGDGKVNVMAYNISLDYSDPNTATASQAQLMSQLQTGENVLVLSGKISRRRQDNGAGAIDKLRIYSGKAQVGGHAGGGLSRNKRACKTAVDLGGDDEEKRRGDPADIRED